jgi:hypothetical protein
MSEVEKLKQYCKENEVVHMGITTAYELGLSDKKPTAEEIAGELNRIHEWLANPVNNLTSHIQGHIDLKKDTIMCMEKRNGLRKGIDKNGSWGPIPMTEEEQREVRHLKEDVELFERAVEMIKELNSKCQK